MATILVIDDDPEERKTFARVLHEAGYSVVEASDIPSGLASMVKMHPLALVITALVLAGGGYQLIRQVKRQRPQVKVLAVAGRHVFAAAEAVIATLGGADRTLRRPVEEGTFLATVRTLLAEVCSRVVRLLVIDYDPVLRTMYRQTLEQAGYAVVEAYDGVGGLQCCQTRSIDLVLMDLVMPDIDGVALIDSFRMLAPCMKIIAVSAGGLAVPLEVLGQAIQAGAHRTLLKPVERGKLLATVWEVLGET